MDLMSPVGVKHRKVHRSKIRAKAVRSVGIKFGVYGLKSLESGLIENCQLEAGRMVLKRKLKKVGSVWILPFTDVPVTGKKSGVRMGKGKGAVLTWVTSVKQGQILFELYGMSHKMAVEALRVVGSKLSVKTKIVVLKE
jgi:large subunit ribosomal protein L16